VTSSKNARNEEPVSLDSPVRGSYPCPEWEEKLVYMHPDDLTETERMELFKHLSQCSACTTFRRRYRVVNDIIRDLPFQEEIPTLELPPMLKHLWEFEDMSRKLACEEALFQLAPLDEISGQVENKMSLKMYDVLCVISNEKRKKALKKIKRSRIAACSLFAVACFLFLRGTFSFICRRGYFRKRRSTVERVTDEEARSTPEKERGVVPV
jgi:hypothetical protein